MRRLVSVLAAALALVAGLAALPRDARAGDEEEPASCLACHAIGATKQGAPEGMRVDPAIFLDGPHKQSCLQCHEDMEAVPHAKKKADAPNCASCHEKAVEKFKATPHGKLPPNGDEKAPTCTTCHPPHAVLNAKDPRSSLHKTKLTATCGQCHDGEQKDGTARIPKTVEDYAKSVHGVEVLEKGDLKAAGCTDCHPVHEMRYGSDPASRTFKPNVPKLCGTCHEKIAAQYAESVHGTALAHGKMGAPACTDCHSEHSIAGPGVAASPVASAHVSQTCANCHAAERIVKKYGIPADRVATYRDSYHGLADASGSAAVANCASCHGFHDILPSSDPRSRINKANLLTTCRRCHEGATEGFVEGRVHAAPDRDKERAAWWVQTIYWVLIPATLGGMLLHNAIIVLRFVREKYRAQRAMTQFVRFRPVEVVQHTGLALSFITLAVTGFALAYPKSAWVRVLASAGMSEERRAWVHRGAAVVFVATILLHAATSVATKHGRYGLRRLLPGLGDLRQARQNVAWHLGLAKEPPRFDRFDYTMKVEYWALVWGAFVMLVTGTALWFKVEVTHLVPRWLVDVSGLVHFYEAILAVAAIVVWHFFFVIFHPAEYPMSLTWLTGRVTEEEMKHAHPAEWERLRDSDYRVPAAPPSRAAAPEPRDEHCKSPAGPGS
jgi:cytochrome b subunit of formate dehydrogenase